MSNFLETLTEVLKADKRFFTDDGTLLRNKVYECAINMDAGLIALLLANAETKKRFFTEVSGVLVFDKVGFGWVVNNRQFLPDSYTRFKNRIGLTDARGDFIAASNDVTLSFPYKDCVLEGGQTKDDQKRDEVFYNETLAPDEVDRLLYPKVLTNARRYTAKGVEKKGVTFSDSDNLIIKGNNLLAIASLLKQYEGKVKCIYIDPPYNTGNDSFGYNDRFNHSTWLTFVKNRLEIARRLLANDGCIWIQADDNESHYLKVLADEVFGRDNFVTNVIWHKKRGKDNSASRFSVTHDHIIVYAKQANRFRINRIELEERTKKAYSNPDNDHRGDYRQLGLWSRQQGGSEYEYQMVSGKVFSRRLWLVNAATMQRYERENRLIVKGDKLYRKLFITENEGCLPETIWTDVSNNANAKDEIKLLFAATAVELFATPKPECLLERIIRISTQPGDLVLDFFAGSGTTLAVAHKMERRYIGIEQMDYLETVTIERLKKVIDGEQGGISKTANWQGGGSFVYCELATLNQRFVVEAKSSKTDAELVALLLRVLESGFISSRVNPADISEAADDFAALSVKDKKRFVLELLDKNMLYVNLCDLDDADYAISDADKAFTRSFYGMGGGEK